MESYDWLSKSCYSHTVNSAVSILILILKQPVQSLPLLSTPNLTTVTLSTTIFLSLKQTAYNRFRTVLHVLWLKLQKFYHITPILLRSLHWLKINECIEYKFLSLTHKVLTTNLTTYTTWSLFSLQQELLICCHPCSTICIFPITNHQPLFLDTHHLTCGIANLFILSTSFCSLSSWFISSSFAYHLITVTTFALTIYNTPSAFNSRFKPHPLPQILSSIVLDSVRTYWFVLVFCLYMNIFLYLVTRADHTQLSVNVKLSCRSLSYHIIMMLIWSTIITADYSVRPSQSLFSS